MSNSPADDLSKYTTRGELAEYFIDVLCKDRGDSKEVGDLITSLSNLSGITTELSPEKRALWRCLKTHEPVDNIIAKYREEVRIQPPHPPTWISDLLRGAADKTETEPQPDLPKVTIAPINIKAVDKPVTFIDNGIYISGPRPEPTLHPHVLFPGSYYYIRTDAKGHDGFYIGRLDWYVDIGVEADTKTLVIWHEGDFHYLEDVGRENFIGPVPVPRPTFIRWIKEQGREAHTAHIGPASQFIGTVSQQSDGSWEWELRQHPTKTAGNIGRRPSLDEAKQAFSDALEHWKTATGLL